VAHDDERSVDTLADDEIETVRVGRSATATAGPEADTGDDAGDPGDPSDTGDDAGDPADSGDDAGNASDATDSGDDQEGDPMESPGTVP